MLVLATLSFVPGVPREGNQPDNRKWKETRNLGGETTSIGSDAMSVLVPFEIAMSDASSEIPPTPTPTSFMLFDNLTMDEAAKVRISPDTGYLVAQPRVARVGIQIYNCIIS
jgi:hypothetical protein